MSQKKLSRRQMIKGLGLAAIGAAASACQPKTVIVEKEVAVEKEVTRVIKETVKETVVVAGTPKVVEKEVTKIVEEVVTATPVPIKEREMLLTVAWGGAYAEMHVEFAKLYMEENPHITLEAIGGQGSNELITMLAGGTPPDVTHQYYCNMAALGFQAALVALEPFIDASEAASRENFEEHDWATVSREGQPYAVPYLDIGCRCTVNYNTSLLEKAGLDPDALAYDNSPVSLDEFFDICIKTTTFDDVGNIDILAYNPLSGAQGLTMWHQALDVPYYDSVHRSFSIYQDAFIQHWNRLKDYYDQIGGFEKVTGWSTANQGWLAGIFSEKQVMHVGGGQWVVGDIRANAPDVLPKMKHGWIPSDAGLKTVKTDGHTISIPKGVEDAAQSWHLLEFLAANHTIGDTGWELRGTYYPWKPWRAKMDFSSDEQFTWLVNTVSPGVADKNEPYWPLDICAYIAQDAGSRERNTFEAVMIGDLGAEEGLQRLEEELNKSLDQAIRGG